MLETLSDLLKGNAKIVLTTRRTASSDTQTSRILN